MKLPRLWPIPAVACAAIIMFGTFTSAARADGDPASDYLIGQHKDIGDLGNATVVLYLVASLGVQRAVMIYRAQRMDAAALTR